MPRGGKRFGTPGQAYANRTDLSAAEAIKTVPGQAYGAAQQQREAQQTIPIKGTQVAPAGPAAGAAASSPAAPAAPPPNPTVPGTLGFADPSARPGEPVQHGLPMGPGAGPEVLPPLGTQAQHATVRDFVTDLASRVPSPALATLAAYAQNSL